MPRKTLKKGAKVAWNTSQGKTTGKVTGKAVKDVKIGGAKLKASKSDPKYIVKSDKTGRKAAHKAGALKKAA